MMERSVLTLVFLVFLYNIQGSFALQNIYIPDGNSARSLYTWEILESEAIFKHIHASSVQEIVAGISQNGTLYEFNKTAWVKKDLKQYGVNESLITWNADYGVTVFTTASGKVYGSLGNISSHPVNLIGTVEVTNQTIIGKASHGDELYTTTPLTLSNEFSLLKSTFINATVLSCTAWADFCWYLQSSSILKQWIPALPNTRTLEIIEDNFTSVSTHQNELWLVTADGRRMWRRLGVHTANVFGSRWMVFALHLPFPVIQVTVGLAGVFVLMGNGMVARFQGFESVLTQSSRTFFTIDTYDDKWLVALEETGQSMQSEGGQTTPYGLLMVYNETLNLWRYEPGLETDQLKSVAVGENELYVLKKGKKSEPRCLKWGSSNLVSYTSRVYGINLCSMKKVQNKPKVCGLDLAAGGNGVLFVIQDHLADAHLYCHDSLPPNNFITAGLPYSYLKSISCAEVHCWGLKEGGVAALMFLNNSYPCWSEKSPNGIQTYSDGVVLKEIDTDKTGETWAIEKTTGDIYTRFGLNSSGLSGLMFVNMPGVTLVDIAVGRNSVYGVDSIGTLWKFVAKDGNWTNWSQWSSCNASCGGGMQYRTRYCNRPAPVYGGRNCSGDSMETQTCNLQECKSYEWSQWSSWSSCNGSCPLGNRTRKRNCTETFTGSGTTCSTHSEETALCLIQCHSNITVVIERQIDASWKDAHTTLSSCRAGQPSLSLSYSSKETFLYFSGATIPIGAHVLDAYLQFSTYLDMFAPLVAEVRAVTDVWTPTQGDFLTCNFNGYSYTSSLMWTPHGMGEKGDRGPDERVPNLGPVVQEVISGPYWNGSGPIVIKISDVTHGIKTVYAHELNSTLAAALTVQYTELVPIPFNTSLTHWSLWSFECTNSTRTRTRSCYLLGANLNISNEYCGGNATIDEEYCSLPSQVSTVPQSLVSSMSSSISSSVQPSVTLTKLSSIAKQTDISQTFTTGIIFQNITLQSVVNSSVTMAFVQTSPVNSPVTMAVSSSIRASLDDSPITTSVNTSLRISALTPNLIANSSMPTVQTNTTQTYAASEPNTTIAISPSATPGTYTSDALAKAETKLPTPLLAAFSYASTAQLHSQTNSRSLTSVQYSSDIWPSLSRSVSPFSIVDRVSSSRITTIEESDIVFSAVTAGSKTESSQPIAETAQHSTDIIPSSTEAAQLSSETFTSNISNETYITVHSHTLSSLAQLKIHSVQFVSKKSRIKASQSEETKHSESMSIKAIDPPVNYTKYGQWSMWGECSTTCNNGTKSRFREPVNQVDDVEPLSETIECIINPCAVDGGWTEWSPWSLCGRPCNGGLKWSYRSCTKPEPRFGGIQCDGDAAKREECNLHICPVDGQWSNWSQWSLCDKPCNNGTRKRVRFCNSPVPKYGGKDCSGANKELRTCNTHLCANALVNVTTRFKNETFSKGLLQNGSFAFKSLESKIYSNLKAIYKKSTVVIGLNVLYFRSGSVISSFTATYEEISSTELVVLATYLHEKKLLGSMPVGYSNVSAIDVPPPPQSLITEALSQSTIRLRWASFNSYLNSASYNVTGFIVTYKKTASTDVHALKRIATPLNTMSLDVKHLDPYTLYTFRVTAMTRLFLGIPSDYHDSYTMQGVPTKPPQDFKCMAMSPTSIFCEWKDIPRDYQHGELFAYNMKYRVYQRGMANSSFEGSWYNVTVPATNRHRTLEELSVFTKYELEISGVTQGGEGIATWALVETAEGAPTAAPQNITVDSYICENHIDVHWYPIPVDKRNGRLHEIQLNYKVMRNDFEGRLYSKVKEVSLSSSERHHRISGLKVNAVISLHMFGSTMGGSGVASSEYIGRTCRCRRNIYSAWFEKKPFVYLQGKQHAGIFPTLMAKMIQNVCGYCQAYGHPVLHYNRSRSGRSPKRISEENLKKQLSDDVDIHFPVMSNKILTVVEDHYQYIQLIDGAGYVLVILDQTKVPKAGRVMKAIFASYTLWLVMAVYAVAFGMLIWFADQNKNPAELEKGHFFRGVGNGAWWAFITMTTVGYGDIAPKGFLGRLASVIWMTIGIVLTSIFTSTLSTNITVACMSKNVMLYGTKIAAIQNSTEYWFGVRRAAMMQTTDSKGKSLLTPKEVLQAVISKQVKGALLETNEASTLLDFISDNNMQISNVFESPKGIGMLLAGDLAKLQSEIRSYFKENRDLIQKLLDNETKTSEVRVEKRSSNGVTGLFDSNSMLFKETLHSLLILFGCFIVLGIIWQFVVHKLFSNPEKVQPKTKDQIIQEQYNDRADELMNFVESFITGHENRIDNLFEEQMKERFRLVLARNKSKPYGPEAWMKYKSFNPNHILSELKTEETIHENFLHERRSRAKKTSQMQKQSLLKLESLNACKLAKLAEDSENETAC